MQQGWVESRSREKWLLQGGEMLELPGWEGISPSQCPGFGTGIAESLWGALQESFGV